MMPHFYYCVDEQGEDAFVNVNHIVFIGCGLCGGVWIRTVDGRIFKPIEKDIDAEGVLTNIEKEVEDQIDSEPHKRKNNAYTLYGSVATYEQNDITVIN